jgi:hypothetical protein
MHAVRAGIYMELIGMRRTNIGWYQESVYSDLIDMRVDPAFATFGLEL